jgi:hypothetical protein
MVMVDHRRQTQGTLDERGSGSGNIGSKESVAMSKARGVREPHLYKQRYMNALKAYHDQGSPEKDDLDQAISFMGLIMAGMPSSRYNT